MDLQVGKFVLRVTTYGNGRTFVSKRTLSDNQRINIITDPEKEKERQKIKNCKGRIRKACGSFDNFQYFFTFTDEDLRHDPIKFKEIVSKYLKKKGIKFIFVIEIYHPSHYGDWILDDWKSSWKHKEGAKWENRESLDEYFYDPEEYMGGKFKPRLGDFDYGIHIHGLSDKHVDFTDWEEEHPSSDPDDLYCEKIKAVIEDEFGCPLINTKTMETVKDPFVPLEYMMKNIKYTKRYFSEMGFDEDENGKHKNLQIYSCNIKRLEKEDNYYIENEDGTLDLITNRTNNEIEDLRNEIFKNQLDHDRKQRELEEVFSCFPINHVENEDIWNEKPVLIHKDNRNYIDFDILTSINSNFYKLKRIYYIKFIVSNIKKDMFSFRNIYLYNKNAVFNNENNVFTNKIFYCSGYYFTSFSSFYPLGFLIQLNSYLKSRKKRDIKNINYAFISRRNNFIYNNVYRSIDLYIYNPVFNIFFKDWLLKYVSYIKNIPEIPI